MKTLLKFVTLPIWLPLKVLWLTVKVVALIVIVTMVAVLLYAAIHLL